MTKKKLTTQRGFTYIELMIAIMIAAIVISGVGIILVEGQRGWNTMYNRVCSGVMADSYVVRRMFDSVIRQASGENVLLDDTGRWLEVYYYADGDSAVVDRYARFYEADGRLNVEYGKLNPRETLSTQTVCENVSGCVFKTAGQSAQMILTLENDSQTVTVASSAVMHNQ